MTTDGYELAYLRTKEEARLRTKPSTTIHIHLLLQEQLHHQPSFHILARTALIIFGFARVTKLVFHIAVAVEEIVAFVAEDTSRGNKFSSAKATVEADKLGFTVSAAHAAIVVSRGDCGTRISETRGRVRVACAVFLLVVFMVAIAIGEPRFRVMAATGPTDVLFIAEDRHLDLK